MALWRWCLLLSVLIALLPKPALAQLTPDDTLGAEQSQVTPNVRIRGRDSDRIDGGTRRGANLFHSFERFNVEAGRAAYFGNPDGVRNIFSRVTGGGRSEILGRLGVLGDANLFFMNPNGILFGPASSLDVQGSFVGTTANAIGFGDQGFFSATNPELPSALLTINPSAFFFNQVSAGNIINTSRTPIQPGSSLLVGLRVADRQTLTLLGGNVTVDGGYLSAFGGRLNVGAVGGVGSVGLNADGSLSFPETIDRADVTFTNRARADVALDTGGALAVTARNLDVLAGSFLVAGIRPRFGSPESQAGNLILNATGDIQVGQASGIGNQVAPDAIGNSGNLSITARSLFVTDGAQLGTSTFGQGNTGSVIIEAQDQVRFDNGDAFSTVAQGGVGQGGNIRISAGSLSVLDGAQLVAGTRGQGDAGSVVIEAQDQVRFVGRNSAASSAVAQGGVGQGGNIRISTGSLSVINGAGLSASTEGQGDAGSVVIEAQDQVRFVGRNSVASSAVAQGGVGQGGNIRISTGSLLVINGAQLLASTEGQGNAGSVIIEAQDQVGFDNGAALSQVAQGGIGQGGNIRISTGSLLVINGAGLSASTRAQGSAGSVIIEAQDQVRFVGRNSAAFSTVEQGGVGQGGSIRISAGSLSVVDGAQLLASTRAQGSAGSVIIEAQDQVRFVGRNGEFPSAAFSTVEQGGVGQGGNIRISAGSLSVLDGAQLVASTEGQGNAGSVIIEAQDQVGFDNGDAFSRVEQGGVGQGGNIRISAGSLSVLDGAQLTANTRGRGNAGSVIIEAQDQVRFDNGTAFSTVGQRGVGQGGNIRISAGSLLVLDGAQLVAGTRGQGDAGRITIDTRNSVVLSGIDTTGRSSGLFTTAFGTAQGAGGPITVKTDTLRIEGGAIVNAQTRNTYSGGDVRINANALELTNGGQITTTTRSTGPAGNIFLNVSGPLSISGSDPNFASRVQRFGQSVVGNQGAASGLFANTTPTASGNGGQITIATHSLSLTDGAQISSRSQGQGTAGAISITATDRLFARNSDITTAAEQASGGNLSVTANWIQLEGDSDIRTNVTQGSGGNITLRADAIAAFEDSDIIAAASQGQGGNITLDTPAFFGAGYQPDQDASSTEQLDGNDRVDINASGTVSAGTVQLPDTSFIQNSLSELPTVGLDADSLIANSCIARDEQGGTFLVTGTGGLPPRPGVLPLSPYPTDTVRTEPEAAEHSSWQPGEAIVEPQGVYRLADGQLVMSRECQSTNDRS